MLEMAKYNVVKSKDEDRNIIYTYTTKIFDFDVDKQPYDNELAQKEYGLIDNDIVAKCYYECYDPDKVLKKGDYVADSEGKYIIVWLHKWDESIEFIIKENIYAQ